MWNVRNVKAEMLQVKMGYATAVALFSFLTAWQRKEQSSVSMSEQNADTHNRLTKATLRVIKSFLCGLPYLT